MTSCMLSSLMTSCTLSSLMGDVMAACLHWDVALQNSRVITLSSSSQLKSVGHGDLVLLVHSLSIGHCARYAQEGDVATSPEQMKLFLDQWQLYVLHSL